MARTDGALATVEDHVSVFPLAGVCCLPRIAVRQQADGSGCSGKLGSGRQSTLVKLSLE